MFEKSNFLRLNFTILKILYLYVTSKKTQAVLVEE